MITLDRATHLGALARRLRHQSGLSLRQLARRMHLSVSGVQKREQTGGMSAAALIDTAHALGFEVALRPLTQPQVRPTGTGWPA